MEPGKTEEPTPILLSSNDANTYLLSIRLATILRLSVVTIITVVLLRHVWWLVFLTAVFFWAEFMSYAIKRKRVGLMIDDFRDRRSYIHL